MNKVVLIGRMCSGVDSKTSQTGTSMASFRMAVRRDYKNASGEYDSDFLNCKAFKTTADYVARYAVKGDMLAIDGRIQTGSYEAKDGTKRYTTDIICNSVDIISSKKKGKDDEGFKEVDDEPLPWEM